MVRTTFLFGAILLASCGDDDAAPGADGATGGADARPGTDGSGGADSAAGIDGADQTDAASTMGVPCGAGNCEPGMICCVMGGGGGGGESATCIAASDTCEGASVACDGPEDCAEGQRCCGSASGGSAATECSDLDGGGGGGGGGGTCALELCHLTEDCSVDGEMCCEGLLGIGYCAMVCGF
jgi:hypothetical protein